METPLLALLVGKSALFYAGQTSAIRKAPVSGKVKTTFLGLAGDEQSDLSVHGGPDKAIHHYPFDHYARWATNAPDPEELNCPGAFGENVSTFGLTEDDVFIGDRFRFGTALVEISQGRQPCWKQGARLAWNILPSMMVRERRSGWYYRVIEEGEAEAGDVLTLVDRPFPDWSVARVFGLLIAGDHKRDPRALPLVAALGVLHLGWRQRALELLSTLD
jgi:MOSC domain-containing protein YiiM